MKQDNGVGAGRHIAKLLEMAQSHAVSETPHVNSTAQRLIISAWNEWIKIERERNPEFRPDLHGFNANADAWKKTPLWGCYRDDDKTLRLQLASINLIDAELLSAHLEGVNLENAQLGGASLVDAHLEAADLNRANLKWAQLEGACFDEACLHSAHLENTDCRGAIFKSASLFSAHLEDADLTYTQFEHAALCGANLRKAKLYSANLNHANLGDADLSGAKLRDAGLVGTILNGANFTDVDVTGVRYQAKRKFWKFHHNLPLGNYHGVRGIDASYGDPEFRRDALDQDFIDSKYISCKIVGAAAYIEGERFRWLVYSEPVYTLRSIRWSELHSRLPRRFLFWLWSWSDYGRSIMGTLLYVAFGVGLIGALYKYLLIPLKCIKQTGQLANSTDFIDPWYAAAMGAATLGLTDLMAPLNLWGKLALFGNALSGLILFGILIAVMQNKVARRS